MARLEFETLISDTSARLMAAAPAMVEAAIQVALDNVRTFFQADRCGLVNVSEDMQVVNVAFASYSEGVTHVPKDVDLVEMFPWSREKLLVEDVPVIVHRMSELPSEAAVDLATWIRMSVRSSLTVPVHLESKIAHLVVLQWVHEERYVDDVYVPRLRVFAELMVNALERKRAYDALVTGQERLDRAATAAGCGLWEIDMPSGESWVTPETRRLYGLTPDEPATYDRFITLVHPDDRQAVTARIDTVMRDGGTFDQSYRIVRDDGVVRCLHASGRRAGPARLVGASIDVTDREAADASAREQAARVAAAVDAAGLGFTEWTIGRAAAYLDSRIAELMGVRSGDPRVHELWLSRVHPDDRAELVDVRQRLLAGDIDNGAIEYRYEHPSRGQIWIRHTSRRLTETDRPGGGVRLISAFQDITEQRQREEGLRSALEEVRRLRDRLQQENVYLRRNAGRDTGSGVVTGRSPAIRNAIALAEQVAPTTSTVLLLGETGTGKERFAEFVHQASPRARHPMVRLNCSAIPSALIESELFGRERGAYTGALSKQIGRFELAHESTLFLDEIGDLPLDLQVKLLRVLQDRAIERLGSPTSIRVDVRIIAATHRKLEEAVRDGTFRADLFYRLNVFPIVIPPLRARPEDISLLVGTLIEELARAMGKRFDSVSRASMDALVGYSWPGNIRELRNVLERAMILSPGPILTVAPPDPAAPLPTLVAAAAPSSRDLNDIEREHILRTLEQAGWRVRGPRGAAAVLGLKPTTLEARMAKFGIRRPAIDPDE